MGCRSPVGDGYERMQPSAKSEASASIVRGRSSWKCCRMGADVKACWRAEKAAAASEDQLNLTVFRVREVRGDVSQEKFLMNFL